MPATPDPHERLRRLAPDETSARPGWDARRDRLFHDVLDDPRAPEPPRRTEVSRRWVVTGAVAAAAAIAGGVTVLGPRLRAPVEHASAPDAVEAIAEAASRGPWEPIGPGQYWHVKTTYRNLTEGEPSTLELWLTSSGDGWGRGGWPPGANDKLGRIEDEGPDTMFGSLVRPVPTEAAALRAWLQARSSTGRYVHQDPTYDTAAFLLLWGHPEPAARAALIRYVAHLDEVAIRREPDGSIVLTRPVRSGNPGDTYTESIFLQPDGAVRGTLDREGLSGQESGRPAPTPGVSGVPMPGPSVYYEMRLLEARVVDRAPTGPTMVPSP